MDPFDGSEADALARLGAEARHSAEDLDADRSIAGDGWRQFSDSGDARGP